MTGMVIVMIKKLNFGYVFHFSTGKLVMWSCKKQKVVSLLTTKEKYHDLVQAGTKVVWTRQILG
jgi:hypothetical protein